MPAASRGHFLLQFNFSGDFMAKRTAENRASSCAFTSDHGRQCTMPRATRSKYCYHHDRKLRYSREAELAALEIFEPIGDNFVPANRLTKSLARLFGRVADGRISPRQANAMSRVAEVMLKSISNSSSEFKDSYRPGYFQQLIRQSFGELPDYIPPVFPRRRIVRMNPKPKPAPLPTPATPRALPPATNKP
jgi:hypothetical protein